MAQQPASLEIYYTNLQALESKANSEQTSNDRGRALAEYYDARVKEISVETAKNETAKILTQYLNYDFLAAYQFTLRLKNLDDAKYFYDTYFNADHKAKYVILQRRTTQAYNTRSKIAYPTDVPLYGSGFKGSWQQSGIYAALHSNKTSSATTSAPVASNTNTTTGKDGTNEFFEGSVHFESKNYSEALKWFEAGADKGHANSMLMLGTMHTMGNGTAQSFNEGFKWYMLSAEKGSATAMYMLALMYTDGVGTVRNESEGIKWHKKAAALGHQKSIDILKNIKPSPNVARYIAANGKYGLKDKDGNEVMPPKYDMIGEFSEGMAAVYNIDEGKRKHGYINETGQEIIPLIYGDALPFSEGLAAVRPLGLNWQVRYGFIDKTGKTVIPQQYEFSLNFKEMQDAYRFENGKAKVTIEGRFYYIDKTGKEIK